MKIARSVEYGSSQDDDLSTCFFKTSRSLRTIAVASLATSLLTGKAESYQSNNGQDLNYVEDRVSHSYDPDWEFCKDFKNRIAKALARVDTVSEGEVLEEARFFLDSLPIAFRNLEQVFTPEGSAFVITEHDRLEVERYQRSLGEFVKLSVDDFVIEVNRSKTSGLSPQDHMSYNWLNGKLVISPQVDRTLAELKSDPNRDTPILLREILPLEVQLYSYLKHGFAFQPLLNIQTCSELDVYSNDPKRKEFLALLAGLRLSGVSYDQLLLDSALSGTEPPPYTQELVDAFRYQILKEDATNWDSATKARVIDALDNWFMATKRSIEFPHTLAQCFSCHPEERLLGQDSFLYDYSPVTKGFNLHNPAEPMPLPLRGMVDLEVAVAGLERSFWDIKKSIASYSFSEHVESEKGFRPFLHFIEWFSSSRLVDMVLNGKGLYYSELDRKNHSIGMLAWRIIDNAHESQQSVCNRVRLMTEHELREATYW